MGFTVKVNGIEIRCDTAEEAAELARVRAETSDPGRRSFGSVRTEQTPKGTRISAQWWEGGRRRRRRGFQTRTAAEAFLDGLKGTRGAAPPRACLRCQATDHTTEVCPQPRGYAPERSENAQPPPADAPAPPVHAASPEVEKEEQPDSNSSQVSNLVRRCRVCREVGHNVTRCPQRTGQPLVPKQWKVQSFDSPAPAVPGGKSRSLCRNCLKYGHWSRNCPNPTAELPAPTQSVEVTPPRRGRPKRHVATNGPTPPRSSGIGSGRRQGKRVCKKCGTPGHVQKGCPEGREVDFKFEPVAAVVGARYRVIEACADESGAKWIADELWIAVERCGPADKHPVQWKLRRQRDGAEEVGWPTLYPFQLDPGPGGPSVVGEPWRVGMGLAAAGLGEAA